MDKILEYFGLTYEELNHAEVDTLKTWLSGMEGKKLGMDDLKIYLAMMRENVSKLLAEEPDGKYVLFFYVPNPRSMFLKARLENYILLEEMLSTPDRAKKAIENQIASLKR